MPALPVVHILVVVLLLVEQRIHAIRADGICFGFTRPIKIASYLRSLEEDARDRSLRKQRHTFSSGELVSVNDGAWTGLSGTRRRRPLRAILRRDASMTEDDIPGDQWHAVNDDYPKCWSEGSCWASNADSYTSDQPTAWRYP